MIMQTKYPFNLIISMFLVFTCIGLIWLVYKEIPSATITLTFFVVGVVFIGIAVLAKNSGIDFWYQLPIDKTTERSILMFFAGIILYTVFALPTLILKQSYSILLIKPLTQLSTQLTNLSFTAVSTVTSSFWVMFNKVIVAPVMEEFILGFAVPIVGSLVLGYGLRKLLKLDFGSKNDLFDFIMAMLFSIILFAVLHVNNASYTMAKDFIFAGVIRLLLNIMIYKLYLGLLFAVGFHMMNNILTTESSIIVKGFLSFPGGLLFTLVILIFVWFLLTNLKSIFKEGSSAIQVAQKGFIGE